MEIPLLDLDLHRAKVERRIRPLTAHEPIDPATLTIDPGLLPPVVPHDPPNVEDVTQLVDAFFAQLQWTEPDEPTCSDDATAAKGRPLLTREEEEDPPTVENPVTEFASPCIPVDVSVERDG